MDGISVNLESNSVEVPIDLEDDTDEMERGTSNDQKLKLKRKRRLTSPVWSTFEILPVGVDGKQKCKCKDCGSIYLCDSKYGTGNLQRHIKTCVRKSARDIGQLILS